MKIGNLGMFLSEIEKKLNEALFRKFKEASVTFIE